MDLMRFLYHASLFLYLHLLSLLDESFVHQPPLFYFIGLTPIFCCKVLWVNNTVISFKFDSTCLKSDALIMVFHEKLTLLYRKSCTLLSIDFSWKLLVRVSIIFWYLFLAISAIFFFLLRSTSKYLIRLLIVDETDLYDLVFSLRVFKDEFKIIDKFS